MDLKKYIPVTIVMTYLNRKKQLLNTLKSIEKYNYDVRIIIVDDASSEEESIAYLSGGNMKVITLKDKTWLNPCIAFNTGFAEAKDDIILIQNAENIHMGNILGSVVNNIQRGIYLNYAAYSLNKEQTDRICNGEEPENVIYPLYEYKNIAWGENGWYNHSTHKPTMAHFCSAITRADLYDMGGFDERFYDGLGFDDNEFSTRIIKMGLLFRMIDDPFVAHQRHEPHFIGDVCPGMALNAARWEETKAREEYDVKMFNKIYK
jgi:glycosyltransferase involved in cell wall biosynthesis